MFPLVYILVNSFAMIWFNVSPWNNHLASLISIPSSIIMQFVSRTFHTPTDPAYFAYFIGVGTILQMYLLGLGWEFLVGKAEKLFNRKRAAASPAEIENV